MKIKKNKKGFTPTPILVPFRFLKISLLGLVALVQELISVKNISETKKQHQNWCRGFTLIEMTVSLGLFTIVMFIATSAFLTIVNADRKSRTVRIATDNLNIAIEDMSRRIKTGSAYECNGATTFPLIASLDCTANNIAFTDQNGHRVAYKLNGTQIERIIDPDVSYTPVTSSEITINNLSYIVTGSAVGSADNKQPIVTVLVDGSLGSGTASSSFKIQTTITQRAYDI